MTSNIYVYDQELASGKYQKLLERLETRLTDLGISGKIYRLGPMSRLADVARNELAKNPKTLVAVGGDELISRLAGFAVGSSIPLGIIPIGSSMIAEALGITLENACRTLAARRIIDIDVGRVDNHPFICRAVITAADPILKIDNNLQVTAEGRSVIEVINVIGDQYGYRGALPLPHDGRLNLCILKTESGLLRKTISQSAFVCRKATFERGALKVELDGGVHLEGAKEIFLSPRSIQVIVGKERSF